MRIYFDLILSRPLSLLRVLERLEEMVRLLQFMSWSISFRI